MTQFILKTDDGYSPLILRIGLGLVMSVHGAQKVFGWFGGYGFSGTISFFTTTMHLPWIIGFLVIIIEFVGAIALLAGIFTRVASVAIAGVLIGIVITSHIQFGFFMNWGGAQKGEGIEYFLIYLAGMISLAITGGGVFSVDRSISKHV
ncbi:DoxX family protein [Mucilaginibacter antarcticus]|uniref:DoxX family protein n=1 Tax=Mucilaginibacter antarcticus TaxID=1855725 RepID=A0ABW5XQ09_9SPHI